MPGCQSPDASTSSYMYKATAFQGPWGPVTSERRFSFQGLECRSINTPAGREGAHSQHINYFLYHLYLVNS